MEAVGEPVRQQDWTILLTNLQGVAGEFPAPVVWRGLDAAGKAGRIGEAVLYAVIASGGRARSDMPTAVAVVRALAAVGLAAEARPMRSSALSRQRRCEHHALNAFLEALVVERGAAANTVAAYRRDLEDAEASLGAGLEEAGEADLRRYLANLLKAGLSPRTVSRRRSALRQFFLFCAAEGYGRTIQPTGSMRPGPAGRCRAISESRKWAG